MKIKTIAVLLWALGGQIYLGRSDQNQKERTSQKPVTTESAVTIESYLGKGFGKQIRQNFLIERIENSYYPGQTSQRYVGFAVNAQGVKNKQFVEIGYEVTPFGRAFLKMLDERKSVQLVLIGYETLDAKGGPTGHVPGFKTPFSTNSPSWQCVPKFMIQGVDDKGLQEELLTQTIVEFGEMRKESGTTKKGPLKKLFKRK